MTTVTESSSTLQAKKDLAESYRNMMELAAWKHFELNILNRIEKQATKDEDNIPVSELDKSIGKMGECRGRRGAIQKIKDDLEYILHGIK